MTVTAADLPARAVSAEDLSKAFGRRAVLERLGFAIEPGAAVGLLGVNGAGKTTLIKLLLGLLPADTGRVELLGQPLAALDANTRGRIAYVPQTSAQFAWLTGAAMLKYIAAFYPSFDHRYAKELIERWKISTRTPIGVLSPGQQQRLSIVRALATRPELLVLDEPIASLDPATRLAVIDELIAERARRRVTILFSSHITPDLERLCSRFAVLAGGAIVAYAPVETFRGLARLRIQGDEAALAAAPLGRAKFFRTPAPGERVLIVALDEAAILARELNGTARVVVDEPGVETILSEWMQ